MSKEVKYNPLIGLARNAKLRRMEMQCDPQWVLDLAAERDELLSANADLDRQTAALNERAGMRVYELEEENERLRYLLGCAKQYDLGPTLKGLVEDALSQQAKP